MDLYRFTNVEGDKLTAVLYAPGFGGGWSTWGSPSMATDPVLIQRLLDESGLMIELPEQDAESVLRVGGLIDKRAFGKFVETYYPDAHLGFEYDTVSQLAIAFVPQGTLFRVEEYDGSESIEKFNSAGWIQA